MDSLKSRLGWAFTIVGLILIFALNRNTEVLAALSPFEQVERRIPGGALFGLGLLCLNIRAFKPVLPFLASVLGWMTLGALTARLIGLVFVTAQAPKQWTWVGLEVAVMLACAVYLRRHRVKT
jgi:hypothetical protein